MPKNRKARYLLVLASLVLAILLQFINVFNSGIEPIFIAILIGVMAFAKSSLISNVIGIVLVVEPVLALVVFVAHLIKGNLAQVNHFLLVTFGLLKLYPIGAVWIYRRFIQSKPADLMAERAPKSQRNIEK